jgi:mRNA-degrading endonuclease RelE of RelBE toxin-antitoxin system
MQFRIADTFTDSLARLTSDEQKVVKTTAFDLQVNPASPGMAYHKLDRAKDKNFWSVRVNDDIRLIVHKVPDSLLLCYVDHHDKAYAWAARRRLQTHPKTGAAQLVEIRETVQEVTVPIYVAAKKGRVPAIEALLFAHVSDDVLLGYGVPTDWLGDVRTATENTLLTVADHLPVEAAEALLELATGGSPQVRQRAARIPLEMINASFSRRGARREPGPIGGVKNPFDHPDAQRRFHVMANVEELQRALDFPWEKWTIFLHPEQRQ